jgi:hypothetical protein
MSLLIDLYTAKLRQGELLHEAQLERLAASMPDRHPSPIARFVHALMTWLMQPPDLAPRAVRSVPGQFGASRPQ